MTVEDYLRSLVPGLDLQDNVVARCARSPKEVGLDPLPLDDDIDYIIDPETHQPVLRPDPDNIYQMRLDYASSTVYYSVLGVFAGGGYSEQVGDVRASRGGYTITMADRARFKSMGDALRQKWGWDIEDEESTSEMYDASSLRYKR
jgi:hypothetical protein